MSTSTRTNGRNKASREEQIAILTETLTRMDFARLHGMQYGTDRDMYAVGGYPETLSFADFEQLYKRDPIAGRIVDIPPNKTWCKAPLVSEEGQKDGTKFTKAWDDLCKRLGVANRLERADTLARLGQYGVLLIGVAGDDSGLEQELTRVSGPDDVLYLQAYGENNATVDTWVVDPSDPRFGLPLTYTIDLSSGVSAFKPKQGTSKIKVHWSRVIHIAEGLLADEVFGTEALRRVYNDLHDLQKVSTATAEAFWQRVAGILQANIDPAAGVTDDQLDKLDTALQDLVHDLRRTFLGKGVTLSRLAESEPNPGPAADLYLTKIAAGAGIPKRMLMGSETGERSSSEDQKTFLGTIAERQVQYAEPMILRPLIDRLIKCSALPRPGVDGYQVVWPPLFSESELDIATANKARAETAAALTPIGGSPIDLVEIDEERNVWLRPTGERGELKEEELNPEPPPAPVPPGAPGDDGQQPQPEGGEQPDPDAPEE